MPGSKARTKERRPPGPLQVAVLLTENQIVSELRAALVRRELPERYSYWFPISVRAWLDLCSDGAYRNYLRSRGLVDAHAPELAQAALREAGGGLEVISLGAGQADKDMSVVRALRAAGAVPSYRPVDASQMLLELACAAAADAGVVCEAVKADLSVPAHVAAIDGMRDGRPALWLLLGNTLGAFDPGRLCAELRRVVRRRDSLLLDAEIFDGEATIAGYENPLNRRFAFAPLTALGVHAEDGELRFSLQDASPKGFWKLAKSFDAKRALHLRVGGEAVQLRAGESFAMGHSGKFDRAGFHKMLQDGGFRLLADWLSADRRFVMAHVAPRL